MTAVVFDVGETLVDETRAWERIADVYGVPRIHAVSGVAGDALLLRKRDQPREKAGTIGRAVRDERKPHD